MGRWSAWALQVTREGCRGGTPTDTLSASPTKKPRPSLTGAFLCRGLYPPNRSLTVWLFSPP